MKNDLILTMKAEKELSAIGGEQTLFKQPTNHPLITHLSPTFGSHIDAIQKYAAMVVLMLFISVGNVWGADVQKNTMIYFDNSASNWSYSYVYFVINDTHGWKRLPIRNCMYINELMTLGEGIPTFV